MKRNFWNLGILCVCLNAHSESVRYLESALRRELTSLRQELGFPGATAAFVLRDGRSGGVAVGLADNESNQFMVPESRMLAASIGKTFVSATALALASEGRLDLDAPISDWFRDAPWFPRLPQGPDITLWHLLTHRSGLPDHVHRESFARKLQQHWPGGNCPFSPVELIDFILDLPARFVPGEGWGYSDTGYVLLGLVLDEVCGWSLYREVEARFLLPLELKHTVPSNRRALPGLVPGYTSPQNPFGFPVKSTDTDGHLQWHPGVEHFGGGWLSTSGDLARWGAALYAGAGLPESAQIALRRTLPVSDSSSSPRYGPGVSHHPDGPLGPTWGHGGWIPGYVSSLRHYSRHGLTLAFQINTDAVASEDNWLFEMETRLARVLLSEKASLSRELDGDGRACQTVRHEITGKSLGAENQSGGMRPSRDVLHPLGGLRTRRHGRLAVDSLDCSRTTPGYGHRLEP